MSKGVDIPSDKQQKGTDNDICLKELKRKYREI